MPAHPRFPIAPDHDSNGPHDLLQRRSCWLHLLKLGGTVIGTVATGTVRHEAHPSHAGPLPDRVAGVLCVGRWRGLRHSHRIAGQHRWWTLLGAAISALAAVAAGLFDMYRAHRTGLSEDRKSTRLNSSH